MEKIENICRLCLKVVGKDENLHSLTNNNFILQQINLVLPVISKNLKLTENPIICEICTKKLEELAIFRKNISTNELKFQCKKKNDVDSLHNNSENICRLCCKISDDEDKIEKYWKDRKKIFHKCNVHLNTKIVEFAKICDECDSTMQKMVDFISLSDEIEKLIVHQCSKKGILTYKDLLALALTIKEENDDSTINTNNMEHSNESVETERKLTSEKENHQEDNKMDNNQKGVDGVIKNAEKAADKSQELHTTIKTYSRKKTKSSKVKDQRSLKLDKLSEVDNTCSKPSTSKAIDNCIETNGIDVTPTNLADVTLDIQLDMESSRVLQVENENIQKGSVTQELIELLNVTEDSLAAIEEQEKQSHTGVKYWRRTEELLEVLEDRANTMKNQTNEQKKTKSNESKKMNIVCYLLVPNKDTVQGKDGRGKNELTLKTQPVDTVEKKNLKKQKKVLVKSPGVKKDTVAIEEQKVEMECQQQTVGKQEEKKKADVRKTVTVDKTQIKSAADKDIERVDSDNVTVETSKSVLNQEGVDKIISVRRGRPRKAKPENNKITCVAPSSNNSTNQNAELRAPSEDINVTENPQSYTKMAIRKRGRPRKDNSAVEQKPELVDVDEPSTSNTNSVKNKTGSKRPTEECQTDEIVAKRTRKPPAKSYSRKTLAKADDSSVEPSEEAEKSGNEVAETQKAQSQNRLEDSDSDSSGITTDKPVVIIRRNKSKRITNLDKTWLELTGKDAGKSVEETAAVDLPKRKRGRPKLSPDQLKPRTQPSSVYLKCDSCTYRTVSQTMFVQHRLIHNVVDTIGEYKCDLCPFRTTTNELLSQHKNIVHVPEELSFKCMFCEFTCKKKVTSRNHILRHDDKDIANLFYCLVFNNATEEDCYECFQCDFQSNEEAVMPDHVMSHQVVKIRNPIMYKYACDLCQYTSRFEDAYQRHRSTHEQEKKKNWALKYAKPNGEEAEEKPDLDVVYSCEYCNYKTHSKRSLTNHRPKHKEPSQNNASATPSKTSEPDQVLYCNECSYSTKFKSYLIRHMITHRSKENVEFFECPHCLFETKHRRSYTRHMESKHQLIV